MPSEVMRIEPVTDVPVIEVNLITHTACFVLLCSILSCHDVSRKWRSCHDIVMSCFVMPAVVTRCVPRGWLSSLESDNVVMSCRFCLTGPRVHDNLGEVLGFDEVVGKAIH